MRSKAVFTIVMAIAIAVSLHVLAAQAPAPAVGQAASGASVGAQGGRGAAPAPGQQSGAPPAARRGGPNPDPWPGQKKLLMIAEVQTGYHHDAINHTMGIVEQLGRKNRAFVTVIRTDSQLITKQPLKGQGRYANSNANMKGMDYFDAVFLLPSGWGTMTEQQQKDLLAYVHDDGKGLIVGHAAGAAFNRADRSLVFPEWGNLIGGTMAGEFFAPVKVIVEDPKFPGAMSWNAEAFEFAEQHPIAGPPYSRDIDHVILRLDPTTLPESVRNRRPDGDYPVVWARQYGKGRVFNFGWGEFEETLDDPGVQGLLLGAIRWAVGSVDADITPRPMPKGGNK
jgi:type 1 glutamine amidotransferase